MTLDPILMRTIIARLYIREVQESFGENGKGPLRFLLKKLHELYGYFEPGTIKKRLYVFVTVEEDASHLIDTSAAVNYRSLESLCTEYSPHSRNTNAAIQFKQNGQILLWKNFTLDINELSQNCIVYEYFDSSEHMIIKEKRVEVPNPAIGSSPSAFAVPTFTSLDDALEQYKTTAVRYSTCKIYSKAWHDEANGNRIFFRNGPEDIMRDSLTQFLSFGLRSAEVRPEQNVDASHPVDIKVTWNFKMVRALIEIKWIGKSINEQGVFTNKYTDERARRGAKQLSDYLDSNHIHSPNHQTFGYLVVFDARRWQTNETTTTINRKNGLHYQDKEIDYNPKFHEERPDFQPPIRMFTEPICTVI